MMYRDPPADWRNPRKLTEPAVIACLPDELQRHFRQLDTDGYPRWFSTSDRGLTDLVLVEILRGVKSIQQKLGA